MAFAVSVRAVKYSKSAKFLDGYHPLHCKYPKSSQRSPIAVQSSSVSHRFQAAGGTTWPKACLYPVSDLATALLNLSLKADTGFYSV